MNNTYTSRTELLFGDEKVPLGIRVTVSADGLGIHIKGDGTISARTLKESLLRTTTALSTLGYHIPGKKITIEFLAERFPAKPCTDSGMDLPTAVAIIAASGQEDITRDEQFTYGELGLDGTLRTGTSGKTLKGVLAKLRTA